MSANVNAPVRRAKEHIFFVLTSLVLLAFVVIGFLDSYLLAGTVLAPLPSILVHVHAALFVGWTLLFVTQIALAATGRLLPHRRLGVALAAWAALMVLIAPPTAVMALRRGSGLTPFEFLGDLCQVAAFAVLVGRALVLRHDPAAHKRLMLIGTAVLMLPALARLPESVTLADLLALYLLVPVALLVWDSATLRRIHRATLLGFGLVLVVIAATIGAGHASYWVQFVHWVATV